MTGIFRGTGTSVAGIPQPDVLTRVAIAGDTMTGPLNVPAGATGTQVPQRQEIDTALALKANIASPTFTGTVGGIDGTMIVNTPAGNIAAITVQAALNELDTEKALLAGSATQVFSVANGTGSQAINKTQADSTYAALAGLSTQVFSAAAATAAAHVTRADQIQGQSVTAFTTAGTSTAYTLTPTPAITAYAIGQEFDVIFNAACGATPTIAISGLAAVNLVDRLVDGTYYNIPSGRIPINWRSKCVMVSLTQMLVRETPCGYSVSTVLAASAISLTTVTAAEITSILLPPGDWDIEGHVSFITSGTTAVQNVGALIASSVAFSADAVGLARINYFGSVLNTPTNGTVSIVPNSSRFSFSTATTIYLVAYGIFSVSTLTGCGSMTATRAKA